MIPRKLITSAAILATASAATAFPVASVISNAPSANWEHSMFSGNGEIGKVRDSYDGLLARHAKTHGDLMGRVSFSLNAPASDRAKSTDALNARSFNPPPPQAQIERAFQATAPAGPSNSPFPTEQCKP